MQLLAMPCDRPHGDHVGGGTGAVQRRYLRKINSRDAADRHPSVDNNTQLKHVRAPPPVLLDRDLRRRFVRGEALGADGERQVPDQAQDMRLPKREVGGSK